jgi:hypothetical protein
MEKDLQRKENLSTNNTRDSKASEIKNLNLTVDNIPYAINIVPFLFNGENRYYVKINSGEERVFLWDSEMEQFRAVDDSDENLPDSLEHEISNQLLSLKK